MAWQGKIDKHTNGCSAGATLFDEQWIRRRHIGRTPGMYNAELNGGPLRLSVLFRDRNVSTIRKCSNGRGYVKSFAINSFPCWAKAGTINCCPIGWITASTEKSNRQDGELTKSNQQWIH